jgi:hypothetical protein
VKTDKTDHTEKKEQQGKTRQGRQEGGRQFGGFNLVAKGAPEHRARRGEHKIRSTERGANRKEF